MRKVLSLLVALLTLGVASPAFAADKPSPTAFLPVSETAVYVRPALNVWHVSGQVDVTLDSPVATSAESARLHTAHVTVKKLNGTVVSQFNTNGAGNYGTWLPVGVYLISATVSIPLCGPTMCSHLMHSFHSETRYVVVYPYRHNVFPTLHIFVPLHPPVTLP